MDQDGMLRRRRAARRPGPVSLRVRLAAAAASLLAVGAVVIVLAGGEATRDQLTRQARLELRSYALQLSRHPFLLTPLSQAAPGPSGLITPPGAAAGMLSIEVRGAGGQLVMRAGSGHLAGARLHAAVARVLAGRDQPGPVRVAPGGSSLSIAQPVRYRAHRIPYAYSAQDFSVDVTSPAGTGSPGTLVLNLSLDRISQATGRLTVILLGVGGLLVAAVAALAAWTVCAMLQPLTLLGHRAGAIAADRPRPIGSGPSGPGPSGPATGGPATGGSGTGGPEPSRPGTDGQPDGQQRVAPALNATLARLEQAAGPASDPGQASRQATAQMAAAVTSAGQDLRQPLGVLDGLTEYYRHRGQLRPGDFERLLARVEDEAAQISSIIDALARSRPDRRTGPDQPGPPGRAENVGGGA
jgi:signal transduction histidine kinase